MKPRYDDEFECWSDEDRYEPDPDWVKYMVIAIASGLLLGAIYVLFGDFGWGGK